MPSVGPPQWAFLIAPLGALVSQPWFPGSRWIHPSIPIPAGTWGAASPSLESAVGMREGAASLTSAPATHAAPEPAGHCPLRVSASCPSLEAAPLHLCWAPPSLTSCLGSDATFSVRPPLTLSLLPLLYFFQTPHPYNRSQVLLTRFIKLHWIHFCFVLGYIPSS